MLEDNIIKALRKWLESISPEMLDIYIDNCRAMENKILIKHGFDPSLLEIRLISLPEACLEELKPVIDLMWMGSSIKLSRHSFVGHHYINYVVGPGRY